MTNSIQIDKKLKVKARRRARKPLLVALLVLLISLIILAAAGIYLVVIPAQKVMAAASNIAATLEAMKADFDDKDLTQLDGYITDIRLELEQINTEIDKYDFIKDIGVIKGYYDNLVVIRTLSEKTQALIVKALPDLKLLLKSLGYKVDDEVVVVDPTNEENLNALIRELPKLVALYDNIEKDILDLIEVFNDLDPNYIPTIGAADFKAKVVEIQALTLEFPTVSAQVKETLSVLPVLLGSESPADYLIIFQNEKEMRASGGLLTAYGNLSVDKGEINDEITAKDMWALEGYISSTLGIDVGYRNIYGQRFLMERGCGSAYLRAQDSGIYPDLYVTMDMFKDYYDIAHIYDPETYPEYDHIIIINTFFASDMLALVEPIELPEYGYTVTSENLAKVITSETSSTGVFVEGRKNIIGALATAVKEKFTHMAVSDFPKLVQTLIHTAQAKNIAFYSKDTKVQAYLDELGLSGRVELNFAGDYFHLNEAQNCAWKANFYIYDEVTQNIYIDDNGTVSKDVNVHWVNEKVYDPAEENILPGSWSFRYRAWVRFFAPPGTTFTNSDGYIRSGYLGYWPQVYYDEEMQKEVSDNVIYFDHHRATAADPVKTQDLNVSYTLPAEIKYTSEQGYRMLIQKHPGKKDELYKINIYQGGQVTSVEFRLDRDKVLTYKSGVITVENFDTRLDEYYNMLEQFKSI